MTESYQADLKNIAQKLKMIHDELLHLELATATPVFSRPRSQRQWPWPGAIWPTCRLINPISVISVHWL